MFLTNHRAGGAGPCFVYGGPWSGLCPSEEHRADLAGDGVRRVMISAFHEEDTDEK